VILTTLDGATTPLGNRTRGSRLSRAYDGVNTPAEALARARLLLGFPPEANRMETWRATIQSLVDYAGQSELGGTSTRHPPSAPANNSSCRSQRHATLA
jgi:hypothetical protein